MLLHKYDLWQNLNTGFNFSEQRGYEMRIYEAEYFDIKWLKK